jgi:predicted GNAT superfamily acetyltransferase
MFTHFSPKTARRAGALPNLLVGRCQATIGDSTTTTYNLGSHPATCYINRAVVSALTVPVCASGTILAKLYKYDASANAQVALTDDVNLEGLTANEGTAVALLSSLTDAQRTLDTGDTLQFVVVTTNTVGTAQVDLNCNVELFVLN